MGEGTEFGLYGMWPLRETDTSNNISPDVSYSKNHATIIGGPVVKERASKVVPGKCGKGSRSKCSNADTINDTVLE